MKSIVTLCFLLNVVVFSSAKQPALKDLPSISDPQMEFTANKGQWDNHILFQADMKGGRVYLEDHGISYFFYNQEDISRLHPRVGSTVPDFVRAHAVKIDFLNAHSGNNLVANDSSISIKNYFLGNDPSHWATGLHSCRQVSYENIYNGINLNVYSNGNDFKYDFIVSGSTSPDAIQLNYSGCDRLYIQDGKLIMALSVGDVEELHPYAYQLINGEKREVACEFSLKENNVSFRFPKGYDKTVELVIDPTLVFSSYTGSYADNWGYTATYDSAGDLIVGGNVNAFGYPVTAGAYQMRYHGPHSGLGNGGGNTWGCDIAIAKFNPTGTNLIYATYLGGNDNEEPHSLIVDGENNLLVFGITYSTDFPVTLGSFSSVHNGGSDLIISKLNATGTALLASTFVGGSADDGVNITADFYSQYSLKFSYGDECRGEIICDANNDYYITTSTQSNDFPATAGVIQYTFAGNQDAVLFKINKQLSNIIWSTYLGGSADDGGYSVKLDKANNIYVAGGTSSSDFPVTAGTIHSVYQGGIDGFVTLINPTATSIISSTYIGTAAYDQVFFVDLDNAGNVYLCGQTMGTYPLSTGVYSNPGSGQFIHELNASLDATIFSTTFGTRDSVPNISESAFLVDNCGNIYVSGWGRCLNFGGVYPAGNVSGMPITANAFQSTMDGNGCDFYFIVLAPHADSLIYATYFGGAFAEEHVDGGTSRFDKRGTIYEAVCAGCGGYSDFPTTAGVYSKKNKSTNCNNGVIKLNFELANLNISVSADAASNGCSPLTVLFTSTTSTNAKGYAWDFGDGSPSDTSKNPIHNYTSGGTYTVTFVAYGNCNSDTARLTVKADALPATAFSIDASPCKPNVTFNNTTTNASTYLWKFGDGDTSSLPNPVHVYDSVGTFTVTLTANPSSLCPVVVNQTVTIAEIDTTPFFVPNVFTPNNDGKNDLFELKGIGNCNTYHIRIYNRWGKLLFESTVPTISWDGKIKGVLADEGVYFYLLELDKQSFHGAVTLNR